MELSGVLRSQLRDPGPSLALPRAAVGGGRRDRVLRGNLCGELDAHHRLREPSGHEALGQDRVPASSRRFLSLPLQVPDASFVAGGSRMALGLY